MGKYLKSAVLVLLVSLMCIMAFATVFEKFRGSEAVRDCIYNSLWFIALWAIFAVVSTIYFLKNFLSVSIKH